MRRTLRLLPLFFLHSIAFLFQLAQVKWNALIKDCMSFPLRWWPVSTPRSSSPWSIRKSTWQTTCWPGNTSASGSAGFQPSRCPTCPPTAWRNVPASWTCGQCPPPLVMERESPLLGGFITASYQITEKKKKAVPLSPPVISFVSVVSFFL